MGKALVTSYNKVWANVGSFVRPDEWNHGAKLLDCGDWDKAEFRLPSHYDLAVNVDVTGRTLRYNVPGMGYGPYVRVKVTFVADKCVDWYTGETVGQDTVVHGWMAVDDTNQTYL